MVKYIATILFFTVKKQLDFVVNRFREFYMKLYKNIISLFLMLIICFVPVNHVFAESNDDVYDIVLFWGQSNMLGYCGIRPGETYPDARPLTEANTGISQAILDRTTNMNHVNVPVPSGAAYEFRYSKRNGNPLIPITSKTERFGEQLLYQNGKLVSPSASGEITLGKSAGTNMIPQFCTNYYKNTGHKVIVVLAGRGGQNIASFLPEDDPYYVPKNDVTNIYESTVILYNEAVKYAQKQNLNIGSKFWVSFQGESDYLSMRDPEAVPYELKFRRLIDHYKSDLGLEYGFLVETSRKYVFSASSLSEEAHKCLRDFHGVQEGLINNNDDILLGSDFSYKQFYNYNTNVVGYHQNYAHFTSAALSQIGYETAVNASRYVNGGFAKSISMVDSKKYIEVGKSKTLSYTVTPDISLKKNVTWRSSNPSVISVNANGRITALKEGVANIYVQTKDGKKSAYCTVAARSYGITGVKLDQKQLDLSVNDEQQLTAKVYPSYATYKNVLWNSSDKNVATVVDGNIVAKAKGKAVITVTTCSGGYVDYCLVNVSSEEEAEGEDVPVKSISFKRTAYSVNVGEEKYIFPDFTPANTTDKELEWKVANKDIATVDANGLIKACKVGKTVIYATTKKGGCVASTTISVKESRISSIRLPEGNITLEYGATKQLKPEILPSYASNKTLVYDSSNPKVATVSSKGLITAVGIGSAKIFISSNDKSEVTTMCEIVVTREEILANSITVSALTNKVDPGASIQMNAFVLPGNTTNSSVTWSVDNTEKGFINSKGLLYVKKESACQTIIVTATTRDGSNLTGSYAITVNPPPMATLKIGVVKGIKNLAVGKKLQLKKEITPVESKDNAISYSSSNTKYASVSASGVITAKAAGIGQTVIITAKAMDGSGLSSKYKFTIRKDAVTNIVLKAPATSMSAWDVMAIKAVIASTGTDVCKELYWKSSDTSIATVSTTGIVTALPGNEGKTVTIYAYAKDGSEIYGACQIQIK